MDAGPNWRERCELEHTTSFYKGPPSSAGILFSERTLLRFFLKRVFFFQYPKQTDSKSTAAYDFHSPAFFFFFCIWCPIGYLDLLAPSYPAEIEARRLWWWLRCPYRLVFITIFQALVYFQFQLPASLNCSKNDSGQNVSWTAKSGAPFTNPRCKCFVGQRRQLMQTRSGRCYKYTALPRRWDERRHARTNTSLGLSPSTATNIYGVVGCCFLCPISKDTYLTLEMEILLLRTNGKAQEDEFFTIFFF